MVTVYGIVFHERIVCINSQIECNRYSKFIYPSAGHIVTGNLKIIPDSRICITFSKGPKYKFLFHINFNRCREEIAST